MGWSYPNDPEFVPEVFDSGQGCLDDGVVLGREWVLDRCACFVYPAWARRFD
jgi:hypothetical protein